MDTLRSTESSERVLGEGLHSNVSAERCSVMIAHTGNGEQNDWRPVHVACEPDVVATCKGWSLSQLGAVCGPLLDDSHCGQPCTLELGGRKV